VSTIEDRLRDQLQAVAGRVQAETLRPLRPPTRSRRDRVVRWLAPVAAMGAVAGIITGVTLAMHPGSKPSPPARAAPLPSSPRFYVTLRSWTYVPRPTSARIFPFEVTATLRSSATGAVVDAVTVVPWPAGFKPTAGERKLPTNLVGGVSASADERVFAITAYGHVYLWHVSATGQSLTLDTLRTPTAVAGWPAAISPDGRELAYTYTSCYGMHGCRGGIKIVTLGGGPSKGWLGPLSDYYRVPANLAFTRNGRQIQFNLDNGVWLLNAAGPGGALLTDSRQVYNSGISWFSGTLTPDGNAILTTQVRGSLGDHAGRAQVRIVEISPQGGRLLKVLATTYVGYLGSPDRPLLAQRCALLSVGPTGLHVLLQCTRFGRFDGSRFTPLPGYPAATANGPFDSAAAAW